MGREIDWFDAKVGEIEFGNQRVGIDDIKKALMNKQSFSYNWATEPLVFARGM